MVFGIYPLINTISTYKVGIFTLSFFLLAQISLNQFHSVESLLEYDNMYVKAVVL